MNANVLAVWHSYFFYHKTKLKDMAYDIYGQNLASGHKVYQLLMDSWNDMIELGMYYRDRISDKLWKSIQNAMYKDDGYDRSQDMGD